MIGMVAPVGVWFVVEARAGRERHEALAASASQWANRLNDCSRTRVREGRLGTDVHDTTPTTG